MQNEFLYNYLIVDLSPRQYKTIDKSEINVNILCSVLNY